MIRCYYSSAVPWCHFLSSFFFMRFRQPFTAHLRKFSVQYAQICNCNGFLRISHLKINHTNLKHIQINGIRTICLQLSLWMFFVCCVAFQLQEEMKLSNKTTTSEMYSNVVHTDENNKLEHNGRKLELNLKHSWESFIFKFCESFSLFFIFWLLLLLVAFVDPKMYIMHME